MTEKQQKIVFVALELFATKGFDATSTSKIAKEAGVSEGLIFRHFKNKDGLLDAILGLGHAQLEVYYEEVSQIDDPREVILTVIDMCFQISEDQKHFWRLIYALKWQADVYDDTISAPLRKILTKAFGDLGYKDPAAEAEVIMIMIDGIVTTILLKRPDNLDELRTIILSKYQIEKTSN